MKYPILLLFLALTLSTFGQSRKKLSIQTIPLKSISPEFKDYHDLHEFKKLIGEAKIVLMGEATHGEGNVFEAKTRLIRFLHEEMGFDALAFESGFYSFNKIPQSIKDGDCPLECWQRSISPIWVMSQEFQPLLSYLNRTQKEWSLTGFDCQLLGEYSSEMLLGDLYQLTEQLNYKLKEKELALLNEAINYLSESFDVPDDFNLKELNQILKTIELKLDKKDLTSSVNGLPVHFWMHLIYNLREVVSDYYHNHPGRKSRSEFKASDSNVRDRLMAENLLYFIKHNPGKKIICWGANDHFADQVNQLEEEELQRFKPMGSILKRDLGAENVFILGTTCASGTYGSISEKPKELPNLKKNSLEAKLKKDLSLTYAILPLNKKDTITSYAFDYLPVKGIWGKVFDAILYLKETNPTHFYRGEETENDEPISPKKNVEEFVTNSIKPERAPKEVYTYRALNSSQVSARISGRIVDSKKEKPVPYVNIGIKNYPNGTMSNLDGCFKLDISKDNLQDTLSVSCIGYTTQFLPVKELLDSAISEIKIEAQNYSLNEVRVSVERLTSKKILRKAIRAIKKNYTQKAYSQDFLYRMHLTTKKRDFWAFYESAVKSFDSNGYGKRWLYMESVKERYFHVASRVAELDTLTGKHGAFRRTTFTTDDAYLDILNYRKNSFLNPNKWFRYDFNLSDTLKFQGKTVFRIEFNCKYPSHKSTLQFRPEKYYGYILINIDDYAIRKIESYTIEKKLKFWQKNYPISYEKSRIFFTKKVVLYEKQGDLYYMRYACRHDNWSTQRYCEKFGFEAKLVDLESIKIPEITKMYNPNFWPQFAKHPYFNKHYQYQELKALR
ncbi:MAG: erythromycin esterase family protein [Marinifilaceae bacterium]